VTYTLIATWIAKPGSEEAVASAILKLIEPSRAERGCLEYRANRSLSDSRRFVLYEEYADESAYHAHIESDHFRQHAQEEAIPLLDARERTFCAPLDEAS
jgi:quinol monooxygenase YgiN